MTHGKRLATERLMRAEKLMKAALASQRDVTQAILNHTISQTSETNRKKAKDRHEKEKEAKRKRNNALIVRAAEIRTKHSDWGKVMWREGLKKSIQR